MNSPHGVELWQILNGRLTRRAALRGAGAIGGAAVLSAYPVLGGDAQEGSPVASPMAADYPEVVVVATEFAFDMPATTPAGLTLLTMQNDGALDHHAIFLRLNDGAAWADLEAALTQPDVFQVLGLATSVGGPEVGPGGRASVIVDLEPGQYMVICAIPDEQGIPHYMMGMQAPLDVTEAEDGGSPPTADAAVELVDFAFDMPAMEIAAGQHVWEVLNVGEQVHEMVILDLAEGVTFEQFQSMMAAPPATPATGAEASPAAAEMSGPPPFAVIGGVAPMSPGFTNWAVLDLEAGEYVAICFVPDPETFQPHFALGMVMPFTVG